VPLNLIFICNLNIASEKGRGSVAGRDGKRDTKFQLCGWLLFVLSAVFFIAASIRSGDMLGLIGGLLFFVACIVFLTPFFRRVK